MKLLVGLGNPGSQYQGNRHNVGFMFVDRLADAEGLTSWRKRFQGLTVEGRFGSERVVILKPQTYMNESGQSVGEAARFLKIDPADVIVFYDEIDIAPGKLKVKTGGGNAGHNGLRSISSHLGNDYVRVRIGVGRPAQKDQVANYVLRDFAKSEHTEWLDPLLDAMAKSVTRLLDDDAARFTGDVAKLLGPPPKAKADKSEERAPSPARSAAAPRGPKSSKKHPAGERQNKRQSALADNLNKWLAGQTADKNNK